MMNKSSLGKVSLGVFVVLVLGFFMVFAEIDSYNIDTWGFSTGGEIINNYYNQYLNPSLNVSRVLLADELCASSNAPGQFMYNAIGSGTVADNANTNALNHPCVKTFVSAPGAYSGGVYWTGVNSFDYSNNSLGKNQVQNISYRTTTIFSPRSWNINASKYRIGIFAGVGATNGTSSGWFIEIFNTTVDAYIANNTYRVKSTSRYTLPIVINSPFNWYKAVVTVHNVSTATFELYNSTNEWGEGDMALLWNETITSALTPSCTGGCNGGAGILIQKIAGTTGTPLADVDFMGVEALGEGIRR